MTPKHKVIVRHMGGGYTDNNGIKHLTKSEQSDKIKNWAIFKKKMPSRSHMHREFSRGDTFEGHARLDKRK